MHDESRLNEFIQGASNLPVLPKVTIRLLNALDAPETSAREIAGIIEAEPILSARLLKLANSSYYGQRGNISKVNSAVAVLGSKTIRSLALTIWTHTLKLQARKPEEMALMAPLLAHGLVAGIAARMLAERVNQTLSEEAFMAGLLHDIGRVALVAQLGKDYQTLVLDPAVSEGVPLHEKETEILGFDHRALGAALMKSWSLPAFLARVVELHHDPVTVPGGATFFVSAVSLADSFATQLGFNLALGGRPLIQDHVAAYFGLNDEQAIAEFLEICMRWFRMMSEVLDRPR